MRCKFSILFFLFFISVSSQDSKKITEIFFYDFDIEIPTPAFDKKKGFTKYDEMIAFLDSLKAIRDLQMNLMEQIYQDCFETECALRLG